MDKIENPNKFIKVTEGCGWFGMVMIHGATIPTTLALLLDDAAQKPPVSMVLLVWIGLLLFLVRAAGRKDILYLVSNAVGFFLNGALLALIVFGNGG